MDGRQKRSEWWVKRGWMRGVRRVNEWQGRIEIRGRGLRVDEGR